MKFAGAYVPIEKPDKPRVRAVFDRHNGGPSDEYAEVFTAAEVRRPVNVGDPAQVYVDGVYAGLLDPRGRTASDRDNVVRLLAYLHSTGARKARPHLPPAGRGNHRQDDRPDFEFNHWQNSKRGHPAPA